MKKLLFIVSMLIIFISSDIQSNYCIGYDDGYADGWCYNDQFCNPPLSPLCPLPRLNESSASYRDGYNRGFVHGRYDRSNN